MILQGFKIEGKCISVDFLTENGELIASFENTEIVFISFWWLLFRVRVDKERDACVSDTLGDLSSAIIGDNRDENDASWIDSFLAKFSTVLVHRHVLRRTQVRLTRFLLEYFLEFIVYHIHEDLRDCDTIRQESHPVNVHVNTHVTRVNRLWIPLLFHVFDECIRIYSSFRATLRWVIVCWNTNK